MRKMGAGRRRIFHGRFMVIIERKLKGFLPYKVIFWPNEALLREYADRMPFAHAARLENTPTAIEAGRCIVSHNISLTLVIDLRRGLGAVYKDVKPNARIRIHKAERLGKRVTIKRYNGGSDPDGLIDEFVLLFNQFTIGKGGLVFPVSKKQVESYFPHAELLLMYLDDNLICGHVNFIDRELGVSRLGHSGNRRFEDPEISRLSGILNVYLHWYEIEKYSKEGFSTYDLGGISSLPDFVGVNRFKMQFGGRIVREHNYVMAGAPLLWRAALGSMKAFTARGQRRDEVESSGARWRDMTDDQVAETIESSVQEFEKRLARKGEPSQGSAAATHTSSKDNRISA